MKKTIICCAVMALAVVSGSYALAQDTEEFSLPVAGLTPGSPFYFLDRLGEFVQDLFTFNPASKVKLQIAFAAERVAEVKFMLEVQGVEAEGLETAQSRLEEHFKKAADLVEAEKAKGNDVSELAAEVVNNFHQQRQAAKEAFDDAKEKFKLDKAELKVQLREAIEAGDEALASEIKQKLEDLELAKDRAEEIKDSTIDAAEDEKDRLLDDLDEEDMASDAEEELEDAEEEFAELESDGDVPEDLRAKYFKLLSEWKAAVAINNWSAARRLEKAMEELLEEMDKIIDKEKDKKEAEEDEEERKKEAEEKSKEDAEKNEEEKKETEREEKIDTSPITVPLEPHEVPEELRTIMEEQDKFLKEEDIMIEGLLQELEKTEQ